MTQASSLTQDGVQHLLALPTIKVGVSASAHRAIVLQYCLWYGLNVHVWLARVCYLTHQGSEPEPLRVKEWRHYLKAVGLT